MSVLGIIACGMLEDELVHVLSKDRELQQLIIVENRESSVFLRKLRLRNCNPRTAFLDRIPMLLKGYSSSGFRVPARLISSFPILKKFCRKRKHSEEVSVVVNLLSLGLHADLEILKAEVYRNIREMVSFSDRILVFYGICGHALGKLEEDLADLECPLFFLKDQNGETIEDCISLALGGNEAYARAMAKFQGMGTIYLTPMWASSWKKLENETGNRDFNKHYLKNPLYCLAAKIDSGLADNPEFHANVKEFAFTFDMKVVNLRGSLEITEQSYMNARNGATEKQ
ncbi:hypothetical protein A9239_08755 [Methanosarcina sp. A14]|uniref:DUF1638 domain-containing protein n=2 Tax=Methanosarcina barkeri TaxID=2208 RepID=A0A0E3QVF7_METBA|nr:MULTISPECIES: DUF1638 domain-containing protein [Methanosarcina]AKB54629.1 hypothetical protein MSBRM_1631 [Methanosarcina barkeri MS]AKJ37845.1 hypothetical protein MCM1_0765 [Methanosarcina barkeri CM1]OED08967.1 hypothetical protein A9239_08755 [Methanosarcina sp. A14]